ncbi:MAG TPA: DNA mismatch repair endonuclease MutL [Clostridiales bacterium]|nr:DNA mismatch repair endonuclease MutL [Clostridiales bacterium]
MKINILSPNIYNLIAAGEVVENPSSIIKELTENSIDASANNISIHIEDGGIKAIIVSDDGIGIPQSEIEKAVLPHSTSKINTANDLNSISTLGFRGEALASISAVSDFEIKSRYYNEEFGKCLKIKGNQKNISSCGANIGTTITVKNLFFNTPARYKFLGSVKNEENKITRLVKKIILSNPDIAFKYYVNSTLTLASDGNGLESALKSIYAPNELKNLFYVENNINKIKVFGYISNRNLTKFNKNDQLIIVNGRIIEDIKITSTIQNAYGDRLMKRNFPVYVLNIIVPFDDVDINVHPNKKEIRFATSSKVLGSIYNTVKQGLEDYEKRNKINLFNTNLDNSDNLTLEIDRNQKSSDKDVIFSENEINKIDESNINLTNKPNITSINIDNFTEKEDPSDVLIENYSFFDFYEKKEQTKDNLINGQNNEHTKDNLINGQNNEHAKDNLINGQNKLSNENILNSKNYFVVGQVFGTYILIEYNDELYFIDQHAVHERIIFDNLMTQFNDTENIIVQPLLVPFILDFENEEYEILSENIKYLNDIGFSVELFGTNTLKINSIPIIFENVNIHKFIKLTAQYLISEEKIKLKDIAKDIIAKMACSAAIKGNTKFSTEEIQSIFIYLLENNFPEQCPHGRPTFFKFSKVDIEKKFKRRQ